MTEAMGHGVNQRKSIQMTAGEVEAFLDERRAMTMCSMSPDGSIHAVAMWYGFLDGCVTVETKAKSQKAQNLRRDPRLTLLFEDGDYYEELRGVELVGHAELVEDPEKMFELGVNLFERYYGNYTDDLRPFVETMTVFGGTNFPATSTAESSSPPGLLRKSITSACIPSCSSPSSAWSSSSEVFSPNSSIRT